MGYNVNALDSFFNHSPCLPELRASSVDDEIPLSIRKIPPVIYIFLPKLLYREQVLQGMYPTAIAFSSLLAWRLHGRHFLRNCTIILPFFPSILQMGFYASFENFGMLEDEIGPEWKTNEEGVDTFSRGHIHRSWDQGSSHIERDFLVWWWIWRVVLLMVNDNFCAVLRIVNFAGARVNDLVIGGGDNIF